MQVLGGLLEDEALGAALALDSGDEGGEAVEGEADGFAALLLCAGVLERTELGGFGKWIC